MTKKSKKKSKKTKSHGQVPQTKNSDQTTKGSKKKTKSHGQVQVPQTKNEKIIVEKNKKHSDKDKNGQVFINDKQKPNLQKKDQVETLLVKVFKGGMAEGPKDKVKPNSPEVRITSAELRTDQKQSTKDKMECKGHVYPEDLEDVCKYSSPTASICNPDNCVVNGTSSEKESSSKSGDSPRGKNVKKKWVKVDLEFGRESPRLSQGILTEGVVYEAVVTKCYPNTFVALVGQEIKVLVFRERFKPRECKTFKNVPFTCVLKIGDRVKLTAVKKHSKGDDGEEWVAEECWQEDPVSARGRSQETQRSIINKIGSRAVKLADGNYAFAEVLFLFGFRLAHANVDLTDIFQLGDELMYTLPCDVLDRSGPFEVEKAWFGSLPADGDDKPSNQQQFELMKFFKSRTENVSMSVITAACGLNKNAASVKDDFEDVYSDIFSKEYLPLPTMPVDFRNNKRLPTAGKKSQQSIDITSSDRVHKKIEVKPAKLENKTQQETISSRKVYVAGASMKNETSGKKLVDAATQTCVTGDLMCFYTVYNSDSDSD